jgi:hypothetical protein
MKKKSGIQSDYTQNFLSDSRVLGFLTSLQAGIPKKPHEMEHRDDEHGIYNSSYILIFRKERYVEPQK